MNNYLPLQLTSRVTKQLKKIQKTNKPLYDKFNNTIKQIRMEPYMGERKAGDLKGVFSIDIFHAKANYELAYTLREDEYGKVILVILIGTRENFYESLKRYIKKWCI